MGALVLGMHRSGTSAVTGVLERMGCRLGPEAVRMPAQPDNPRGFGELLTATAGATHFKKLFDGACACCFELLGELLANAFNCC